MLPVDRRSFIAGSGGAAAIGVIGHEARVDALGAVLPAQLNINSTAVARAAPFVDLIGRRFEQPTEEGLGNHGSPVAPMWRTIANPNAPL